MRRLALVLVLAVGLLLTAAARADDRLILLANTTRDVGHIELLLLAQNDMTDLVVGEVRRGKVESLRPFPVTPFPAQFTENAGRSGGRLPRAYDWRCDRIERTFIAYGRTPQGELLNSRFQTRTPSCRERLRVELPVRSRPGDSVDVEVVDTWRLGGYGAEVCSSAPGVARRCRTVRFAEGEARTTTTFTPRKAGRWIVTVRSAHQRVRRPLSVGVEPRPEDLAVLPNVLTTGDSLMQGLDGILRDDLRRSAIARSDVRVGSGLSSDLVEDWAVLPGKQVRKHRPDATVLFLGANDSYAMRPPGGGAEVGCCGPAWITEYARRARRTMLDYTRGGRKVFWLTVPAARQSARNGPAAAVNAGLYQAAEGVRGARVLDMVSVFTPGMVWRERMADRGKVVRVFQDDGIHLTTTGQQIASRIVVRALERSGVL